MSAAHADPQSAHVTGHLMRGSHLLALQTPHGAYHGGTLYAGQRYVCHVPAPLVNWLVSEYDLRAERRGRHAVALRWND